MSYSTGRGRHMAAASIVALVAGASGAFADPASVDVSAAPVLNGANAGCTQITIKVDPKNEGVRDVHLWLGSHTYSAPKPPATTPPPDVTTKGDPGSYRQTPGAALPGGWSGGVSASPLPPPAPGGVPGTGTSNVQQNWEGNADLAGPTTFTIDYCGSKPLTKSGTPVTITGKDHVVLHHVVGYAVGAGG